MAAKILPFARTRAEKDSVVAKFYTSPIRKRFIRNVRLRVLKMIIGKTTVIANASLCPLDPADDCIVHAKNGRHAIIFDSHILQVFVQTR